MPRNQAKDVVSLASCHVGVLGVGVNVNAVRNAQTLALGDVAQPVLIVLVGKVVAVAHANDGELHAIVLHCFPIDCAVVLAHVDALGEGAGDEALRAGLAVHRGIAVRGERRVELGVAFAREKGNTVQTGHRQQLPVRETPAVGVVCLCVDFCSKRATRRDDAQCANCRENKGAQGADTPMSQDSHVYTPNLVRIVREGGIPLAFSLSIRERAHRGHIAHGIGTTEGPCDRTAPRNAHARPHDPAPPRPHERRPRSLAHRRPRAVARPLARAIWAFHAHAEDPVQSAIK